MALTENTPLTFIRGELSEAPVKGTTTIYDGAMLGLTSGYARGLVAGDLFMGHAMEYVDNSGGSDGTLFVKVMRGIYRLEVTLTGVAVTDVKRKVYASADDTLTFTAGSYSYVGKVVRYVTTNTAIVEFHTVPGLDFALTTSPAGEEKITAINLTFTGTGGPKRGLYFTGNLNGASNCLNGMWKFRTYVNGAMNSLAQTLCANLHIKDDGVVLGSSGEMNAAIYATVETEVETTPPALDGADIVGIELEYYCDETTSGPRNAYMFGCNGGVTYKWDGLLFLRHNGDVGDSDISGSTDVAFAGGAKKIPIKIGSTTYYLVACVTPTGS